MIKGKILVTGGAGYIGSHTCIELLNAGYEPVIIDNFSNSEKFIVTRIEELSGRKVKLIEGDCTNEKFLLDSLKGEGKIEGIIHFAAYKAVGESSSDPLKYYINNISSTTTILSIMGKLKCKTLVFSSSCTVYGQPDHLPVTESSPMKPAESPYGRTKQICEDIISDFVRAGNAIKSVALRYFNPIGAHPSSLIGELPLGTPNNLVPYITQTAAGIRKELTIFGNDYNTPDGTCIRDYIHVVDLAKAHVAAIEYLTALKHPNYDVVNIGTGKGHSVLEVVNTFEQVNQIKLPYKIGERRKGDIEKVFANASYSKNILNWEAKIDLKDSLKDAWNWQKKLIEGD